MSALKQQISNAVKDAMRAKEKQRLTTLRMIMSEIKRIEVDERIEVDDTRVLSVLDKMSKQRKDSITQFESAGRTDLVDNERQELEVIKSFLPQPLSENELNTLIAETVAQTEASSMQDMGKVMAQLKPKVQGRADMGLISTLVKSHLSN